MENNGNNNVEQMGILHFHFLENCLWLYNGMCQNSWFISMTSSVFQKKNDWVAFSIHTGKKYIFLAMNLKVKFLKE